MQPYVLRRCTTLQNFEAINGAYGPPGLRVLVAICCQHPNAKGFGSRVRLSFGTPQVPTDGPQANCTHGAPSGTEQHAPPSSRAATPRSYDLKNGKRGSWRFAPMWQRSIQLPPLHGCTAHAKAVLPPRQLHFRSGNQTAHKSNIIVVMGVLQKVQDNKMVGEFQQKKYTTLIAWFR